MKHCWYERVKLDFSDLGSANNNYKIKKATEGKHTFIKTLSQMVMGGGKWLLLAGK